jgi:hypothetical protein
MIANYFMQIGVAPRINLIPYLKIFIKIDWNLAEMV